MLRSLLLRRGSVYSPSDPLATAMLVVGDRIAWVGQDAAADTHADSADEVIDLDGALVTPAFVDAHVHVLGTALSQHGVDLADARSLTDVLDRIAAWARDHPGQLVSGQGWDEHGWPERRPPTREEIDSATNGARVYLSRVDGHSAVVSTALLDSAPDVAGADGFEGELVRRKAQSLARLATEQNIPDDQRRDLHRSVLRQAASLGIGAVHEMAAPHLNSERDVRTLVALAGEEPLPDVAPYWGEVGAGVARAQALGARGVAGDLTVDGSLGSRSARLDAPYADDPSTRGQLYLDLAAATEHVVTCTEAGLQAGFHCIGDEAIRVAVTAISRAAERCGEDAVATAHHRLEHVEMISAELIADMARLGVVASVQPVFDELWGGPDGMYAARLGRDRAEAMNPFAALSRAGVMLAFGSDTPVTPLGGWAGVRAAVNHHTPEQRLSVAAAFTAATRGGWQAARVDDAGVLAPGMLASYAVWEVPDGTAPTGAARLPGLGPEAPLPACVRTVVRGAVVFDGGPSRAVEQGSVNQTVTGSFG